MEASENDDHTQRDINLSSISCALRNGINTSIGKSHYHALFGVNMVTHGSIFQLLRNLDDYVTLMTLSLSKQKFGSRMYIL